jgi:hypothetical protein
LQQNAGAGHPQRSVETCSGETVEKFEREARDLARVRGVAVEARGP